MAKNLKNKIEKGASPKKNAKPLKNKKHTLVKVAKKSVVKVKKTVKVVKKAGKLANTGIKQLVKPAKSLAKVSKAVKTPKKLIMPTKTTKKVKLAIKKTGKVAKAVTTNKIEKVKVKTPVTKVQKTPITQKKTSLIITAPTIVNKMDKPLVHKKEPKGKFVLEYVVHSSANILFEFLTSPSGLSEWFADDVNIRDGIYTFIWDGSQQQAKLIGCKEPQFIRFKWLDKTDDSFFEFRIQMDDLTGDVALLVSDFAEDEPEMRTSKLLWDSQIGKLLQVVGSY